MKALQSPVAKNESAVEEEFCSVIVPAESFALLKAMSALAFVMPTSLGTATRMSTVIVSPGCIFVPAGGSWVHTVSATQPS